MTSGAARLWLAGHPRCRRAVVTLTLTYTLSLMALLCAPSAVAASGSAALGWTGLRDADRVPIGFYFLSLVSVREAATNNGQDVSLLDPGTWMPWMAAAMERAVDNATAAWWLSMIAGTFIFVMAAALWFLRFALSTGWLVAIAQFAVPLSTAVTSLVNSMALGSIAVTLCVIGAGYHMMRGQPGRGWAMIGTALALTVLLATVLSDPIGDLYSEHGLLAVGRGTGLEIAQAATGAPFASGVSLDAKLDALMANIVTAGVRHPLQVLNFGMVVDDIGGCRQAWNAAIISAGGVDGPGPAHAMATCGAPQALAYAQRLGGSDATLGLVLLLVAAVVSFFYFYVGLSAMLVGIKALYNGILIGPAFLIGMIGFGRALAFAKHCGTELVLHAVQLMVFEVYLAVSAIGLTWVLTTEAMGPATSSAIPRVLITAVVAGLLWLGFRIVDRSFHTDSLGTIGHQISSAWQAGTGAVRQEAQGYRDKAAMINDRAGRLRRTLAGSDTDDSASTAAARRLPSIEWFKPRTTAKATSGGSSSTPAPSGAGRGPAPSAASAAGSAAVAVAAPEVAATAKVASTTSRVLHSTTAKSGTASSPGGDAGRVPSAPSRRREPGDVRDHAPSREPAQTSMVATRNTASTPSRGQPTPATTPSPRAADEAAGRIEHDGRQRPAGGPPRPPREIGS